MGWSPSLRGSVDYQYLNITTKTGTDYTVLDDDGFDMILVDCSGSNRTITLPTAADNENRQITIKKINNDSNNVIIDGEGAETIDGAATLTITAYNQSYTVVSDGSNWYIE